MEDLRSPYALYKAVTMLGCDAELISYKRTMQVAAPVSASLLERSREILFLVCAIAITEKQKTR